MPKKNEITYGDGFLYDVRNLPKRAQEKLADLLEIFAEDVFDPRLHTKALKVPLRGKFAFRITREWRVGFKFQSQNIIQLLVADHRDQIYKRLERLP